MLPPNLLIAVACVAAQQIDPFWHRYDLARPSAYPPGRPEQLLVCVCARAEDRFYTHVMFSHLPDLLENTSLVVGTREWCAARGGARAIDVGCAMNDDGRFAYPNISDVVYVRRAGEVMGAQSYRCARHQRAVIYRARDVHLPGCTTIHSVQLAHMLHGHYTHAYGYAEVMHTLTARKTLGAAYALARAAQKFAAYSFGKFKCCGYYGEFIFRHAVVDALAERSRRAVDAFGHFALHGHARPCPGPFHATFECFRGYKFALVMENSAIDGYLSEKLLHAPLAGAIPVYFGAPDARRYVNTRALIECRITETERAALRAAEPAFNNSDALGSARLARALANVSVERCVDQIEALDRNDAEYIEMLREPLVDEERWQFIDGRYTSCQMARLLGRPCE